MKGPVVDEQSLRLRDSLKQCALAIVRVPTAGMLNIQALRAAESLGRWQKFRAEGWRAWDFRIPCNSQDHPE